LPRIYPALDVIWQLRPDDERIDRLLADLDDDAPVAPLAIEERANGIRVFFSSPAARGRAAVKLVAMAPEFTCEPVEVSDEDWAERSQQSIGAVSVGRFVVAPPWVATASGGERITIQPSMGFGTAHHASTRLCLTLLQALPVSGRDVLDVGTGSGVLAIAAARLGAARVVAVDNDPDALESARENLELNNLTGAIMLEQIDLADRPSAFAKASARLDFNIVLANLTGATLIRYARVLSACMSEHGVLVTSGYGPDESDAVARAFASESLVPAAMTQEDEWVARCFQRELPAPGRA
jgi:ribosomal protein L11 methyltransferase